MFENLKRIVVYTFRMMRKSPVFTLAAVGSLALGIGANSTIFSLVNSLLFQQLPVERPEEILSVFTSDSGGSPWGATSYSDYQEIKESNDVFTDLIAYVMTPLSLSKGGSDVGETIVGERVSANYFSALGVSAAHGRLFTVEQAGEPVAVISHNCWWRRFGADPQILGTTIQLNAQSFTVIGVVPEDFHDTFVGVPMAVWVPLEVGTRILFGGNDQLENRGKRNLLMLGRLKPQVNVEQAQEQLTVIASRIEEQHPVVSKDRKLTAVPVQQAGVHPTVREVISGLGIFLMVVVGIVLLIACLNLANLLLVRASGRQREISIRLALGATRRQLIVQLLAESIVLALVGGIGGSLVALLATRWINQLRPPGNLPIALDIRLDLSVIGFTLALSAVTGIIFGLLPALKASRPDLVSSLKSEIVGVANRYRIFGLRNILVVAQVTVSLVLLIGAALFLRSLGKAQKIDSGFSTTGTVIIPLDLEGRNYSDEEGWLFYTRLLDRIRAVPGVSQATLAELIPLDFPRNESLVNIPGREKDPVAIDHNVVSDGYFSLMDIELLKGRDYDSSDTAESRLTAVINESMARLLWPEKEAVGRVFITTSDRFEYEVVGVVKDSKYRTLGEVAKPYYYLALSQQYEDNMVLHVKSGTAETLPLGVLTTEIRTIDPYIPILNVKTLEEQTAFILMPAQFGGVLFFGFGLLALVLAATGIYGVMANSVEQRKREMAIRMALGAQRRNVLFLVVKESMTLVLIGTVFGMAIALPLMHLVVGMLYGVSAADPVSFIGIAVTMALVALLASYIPARRATGVNPNAALRYE